MRNRRFACGRALVIALVVALGNVGRVMETFPDEQIESGSHLYKQFCQRCHGPNMVTPSPSTYDLRKFPPNARDRFAAFVTKGKGAMPAWEDLLSQEEIDALYAYISQGKE